MQNFVKIAAKSLYDMTTLDDLIIQRKELTELLKYAEIYGGKISVGNKTLSLAELKETLNNLQIEMESKRSQLPPLRRVK